jgi:hypothetical protein
MTIVLSVNGENLGHVVPLSVAARSLGISYLQAYNAVLVGRLTGRRIDGRWWIAADSLSAPTKRGPDAPESSTIKGTKGRK